MKMLDDEVGDILIIDLQEIDARIEISLPQGCIGLLDRQRSGRKFASRQFGAQPRDQISVPMGAVDVFEGEAIGAVLRENAIRDHVAAA